MMGAWDVVAEKSTGAADEWGVVAEQPVAVAKRKVGAGEVAARAGSGLFHAANAYAAAPVVGIARIADAIAGLFGGPPDAVQNFVGDRFVVPSLTSVEQSQPQAGEEIGPVGDAVLRAAPGVGRMLPDLAMGMGLSGATNAALKTAVPLVTSPATRGEVLRDVAGQLRAGAVAGVPAGERRALERADEITRAGGSPVEATVGGMASGIATTGQFALPASMGSAAATLPARIASRGAQGAAINVPAGVVQRQVENATAPASLEQPVMDPKALIADAVLGALFGQMGGRGPARPQTPAELGDLRGPQIDISGNIVPPGERTIAQVIADAVGIPQEGPRAAFDAAQTTGERAIAQQEINQAHRQRGRELGQTFRGYPAELPPDPAAPVAATRDQAVRQAYEAIGENPDSVATAFQRGALARDGVMDLPEAQRDITARQNTRTMARGAFDIAEQQAGRKQDAQDEASMTAQPRDLRDASAAGTTTPEGTAAMQPESFRFLDVRRGRNGSVTGTGPQVEILRELTAKDARGNDVPAYEVRYQDANGETRTEIVAASRVGELSRPANPRFAQDMATQTYAPARGVGTGDQQPQPRRAAQRITTEESPELLGPDLPARAAEPPRQPDTIDGESRAVVYDENTLPRRGTTPLPRQGDVPVGGSNYRPGESLRVESPDEADARVRADRERGADGIDFERRAVNVPEQLYLPAPGKTSRTDFDVDADGRAVSHAQRVTIGRQEPARNAQQQTEPARPRIPAERESSAGGDSLALAVEASRTPVADLQSAAGAPDSPAPRQGKRTPMEDERLRDPEYQQAVRDLSKGAGWAEKGGRMIRDEADPMRPVTGRTSWMGEDWWQQRPADARLPRDQDGHATREAVRKAEAGEPLSAAEKRAVRYMLDHVGREIEDGRVSAEEARLEQEGKMLDSGEVRDGVKDDEDFFFAESSRTMSQEDVDAFFKNTKTADDQAEAVGATRRQGDAQDGEGVGRGSRQDERQGASEQRPTDQPGRDGGSTRGSAGDDAFALRGDSPDELRARDADERVAAERQRARDNAPDPEGFRLTGSDRAADEGDAAGQGTLYANPIGKVFGWAAGSAQQWGKSLREFVETFSNVKQGRRAPGSLFRAIFDTAAGEMGAIVDKSGSKTARWVYDQFAAQAGGKVATAETMQSAMAAYTNARMVELDRLLKRFADDKGALQQIVNLVRSGGARAGTPIHDAAIGLRKMLDAALRHLRDAGVDVGEVRDGYFPREFKTADVLKDSEAFINAAARAYRESGVAPREAQAAARELYDSIAFGQTNSLFKPGAGQSTPFLKGRVFGKSVDAPSHPLNRFLESDPTMILSRYFDRVGRRAEIAKRFGDNFSKWEELSRKIRAEGGGEILQKLGDFAAMGAGVMRQGGDKTMAITSALRTWGALMFLEKAVLSSLTEFIIPAVRTGNLADAGRSLAKTIGDLVQTTKGAERRAFAEDLGLLTGHLLDNLQVGRFVGDNPTTQAEHRILNRYFRRTGLTQWTEATTAASADLGRIFLRRLAFDVENGGQLTKRYLAELGVPADKAADFGAYVRKFGTHMPAAGDLRGEMGDLYRAAIRRFAHQSIMKPDQTLRPRWMSHPVGSVIGQLQSFNYAFFENVIKRTYRLSKDAVTMNNGYDLAERGRMLMPLLTLPLVASGAFAVGELRDAMLGDKDRRREETGADKIIKAVGRGVPIAPIDPIVNAFMSSRYQSSVAQAALGPVLGTLTRGADASIKLGKEYLDGKEGRTNSAERAVAKFFYDVAIEPTLNVLLYAAPVTPLTAAATVAGIPMGRNAFVDAVAGEKKERRSPSY